MYIWDLIKLGKVNQTIEIAKRIRLSWAATEKLGMVPTSKATTINLKIGVFNM